MMINRRTLLGRAVMALGTTLTPGGQAIAQYRFASQVDGRLQQLAPGIYAWLQSVPKGESGFAVANCGLIATGAKLLAIDATASPVQALNFMNAARSATGKEFGRVVLTHFHGDHIHGLTLMGPVDVIAQENCRVAMAASASNQKPSGWQRRPGWATGEEPFKLVLPDITYADQLRLYEGDTIIDLISPHRAHTDGDTVVLLKREKIAFIGDLGFFGMTPLMGDGYCSSWIAACDRLLAMDLDIMVPGHGPVGGKPDLKAMRDYLIMLRAAAKTQFRSGVSAGTAAARIDLGPYAHWPEADRVVDNVVRLYAEFDGTIAPGRNAEGIARARREYEQARHNSATHDVAQTRRP